MINLVTRKSNMQKKILIIVAHKDDECIGMAATIKKLTSLGYKVYISSLTDGIESRQTSKDALKVRNDSALLASRKLGFEWIQCSNFPDNALDSIPLLDLVKFIEKLKKEINPVRVYTHCSSDLNIDHRKTFEAVLTAFRPHPEEICSEILSFEVNSATDFSSNFIGNGFRPNYYENITDFWKYKESALNCYNSEMRGFPHSRSIENIKNLALYRGSNIGVPMAEAFQLIRKINQ